MLLDEQGRLPHQRGGVPARLQQADIPQPERLMRIFDQGFQHDIDRRFQSAETLSEALLACLEPQSPAAKADALQSKILEHAQSPVMQHGKAVMKKLYDISGQINQLCDRMLGELGGVVSRLGGPTVENNMSLGVFSYETGFLYSRDNRVHVMLGFVLRHVGTEIIVSVYSLGALQVELRVPASSAELTADDLERIRETYLTKLAAAPGAI